jgi:hypothetical protein
MVRYRVAGLLAGLLVLASSGRSIRAQDAPGGVRESWDAIYIGSDKVGHTHIKVAPVKDATGRELLRVQVNTVLDFKRGRDRIALEQRYGTIETIDGAVLRLDTRDRTGREELRTSGDVVDGKMNLTLEGGGQRVQKVLEWGDDVRGPYAAELSLSRQPIQQGEQRDLKTFIPGLNQICTMHLKATGPEPIALGDRKQRTLMRVEQTVADSDGKTQPDMAATLWVDDSGQVLKSRSPLLGGMEAYRTTKAGAQAPNGRFDLLAATVIRIPRPLREPTNTRHVVYQLTFTGGDLAEVFPNDQRQQLQPGANATTGRLEVRTDGPATGSAASEAPSDEFLRANPLINSDDPTVANYARRAIGSASDPWSRAVAIQDWVFKNMKKKNFGVGFAAAKEVARNLEGDCSEHGVLTAAMCRAAGIPCRVVVGLVYAPDLGGFGPHLWNEVFVNGRWVAIDATFNESEVDATHIKLAESSLDGVAPFEAFLPVLRIFNQLKLEPVEVR